MYLENWITWIFLVFISVVILTFLIISCVAIYKSEKILVNNGQKDEFIKKEYGQKPVRKNRRVVGLIVSMIMLVLIFCLFSLTVYAVIVKDGGNIVYLFDRGRLVIVSNSMSSIADEKDYYNQLVEHGGYLTPEMVEKQFARGDILYFNPAPSLEDLIDKDEHGQPYLTQNGATIGTTYASKYLNKVFAFKYGDMVLVHRLVSIKQITNHEGGQEFMFVFMGDLYPTQTQMVSYDKIEGVATGEIIRKLGFPILFLSSVFGIYTIIVSVGIMVVTNVTAKRIEAEYNNRLVVLGLKPEQTNKKNKN